MNFLPTLGLFQWIAILAVPPAIVALYFLKLKRMPLEVPSTYLWARTIEDLHVNTIWQRLRQSLLLFLQLLIVTLLILACLNFGWRGMTLQGKRFIFMIDTSASMAASDVEGERTRLDLAKQRVGELIDRMKSGDRAMLITFSDTAQIEQSFTDSRSALRAQLRNIKPTRRASNVQQALEAAAGLANPAQTGERSDDQTDENQRDTPVAEAKPATCYVFSDGGFEPAHSFNPEHLAIRYVKIGDPQAKNVGITSFTTQRNPENPSQTQAFARLENFGDDDTTVSLSLFLNDESQPHEAVEVDVEAGDSAGVEFDLATDQVDQYQRSYLRLQIEQQDDYAQDNVAYAAVNAPRRAAVLLVTPGNDALRLALATEEVDKVADLSIAKPAYLEEKQYEKETAAGAFDLVIYDRCRPQIMPQANTFFIGAIPNLPTWTAGEKQGPPIIDDTDQTHPLMRLVAMGNILIAEGFAVGGAIDPQTNQPKEKPPGGAVLISSDIGSLLTIAPREGFEDAVLGFDIFSAAADGGLEVNTDWYKRLSFPLFVQNVVEYLGGAHGGMSSVSTAPGRPVLLRAASSVQKLTITTPGEGQATIDRGGQNAFIFTDTERPGVYAVREEKAKAVSQRFAVNLFDRRESDIRPKETIPIGYEDVQAESSWQAARKETWKWLLLAGLGVLLFEWYVFNRRVYL